MLTPSRTKRSRPQRSGTGLWVDEEEINEEEVEMRRIRRAAKAGEGREGRRDRRKETSERFSFHKEKRGQKGFIRRNFIINIL
jgi:hypothetical protein